ncbi:MAG: nucleotide exchange factor GrpE [Hyphomicrobiales bacterium]|nr:nucleotide exchange factor GrpE [Hyphomicrobiales bacterium]
MTDETAKAAEADAAPATEAPATETPATETPAVDPIEALAQENAELKDRLLRTLAEMENLRRRTEKETKDARDYAVTGFARDLLSVADNFDRALSHAPEELRVDETMGGKALIEGVELTGRELLKTLEKHGVKKLSPLGEKFDPNLHQAMFEIPNPQVVAGTVLQVMQDGFAIAGRVLRPALVGVAKGGPKSAAEAAAQPEAAAKVDKTV